MDQVWWFNIKCFLNYSEITLANLCKLIHDIINYSASICPFVSGKCGKEGKKLQKFDYLENEKSFIDEIKNILHSFWRAIIVAFPLLGPLISVQTLTTTFKQQYGCSLKTPITGSYGQITIHNVLCCHRQCIYLWLFGSELKVTSAKKR